ncbi:MAG: hypothetical protein CVU08_15610, partial [Bacteroidetes bacterium HGW-Bacteroidetes-3]
MENIDNQFNPVLIIDPCNSHTLSYAVTGATTASGTGNLPATSFNIGINTITYTLTHNTLPATTTCSFTITVVDNQLPIITCPSDIIDVSDPGVCGAVVTFADPIATDNCGVQSINNKPNILFVSDNGNTTEIPAALVAEGYNVTTVLNDYNSNTNPALNGNLSTYGLVIWHAVGHGSGASHNATTTANLEAYVQGGGNLFITGYDVIASPEDVNVAILCGGTTGADNFANGNLTVLGPGNNLTTGLFNIVGTTIGSVADSDILIGLTSETVAVIEDSRWTLRTIPDGGQVAFVSTSQSGTSLFPAWNSPGTGYYEALRNFASNTTTSSGSSSIIQIAGFASGSVFPVGTTTNTFVVTEVSGNTVVCSFDVTITDNQAPVVSCAGLSTTITTSTGNTGDCQGQYSWDIPIPSDNCEVVNYTVRYLNPDGTIDGPHNAFVYTPKNSANGTPTANRTFDLGVTTVTYYVEDAAGNTSTCSFTVTVTDNQAPTFVNCPSGTIYTIGTDANCSNGVIWPIPVVTDNCGVTSYLQTSGPTYGSQLLPGTYDIVYTARDAANNSTTCGFTVIIVDDDTPFLVCQPDVVVNANTGVCTYLSSAGEFNPLLSVDNCPNQNLSYAITGVTEASGTGNVPVTTFNIGTSTITYTLTDNASPANTTTCSFTVTVIDDQAPIFTCPTAVTANTDADQCNYTYSPYITAANVADNCTTDGSLTITYKVYTPDNAIYGPYANNTPFDFPVGISQVEYKVLDVAGNYTTCTQQITITDNQNPSITCPTLAASYTNTSGICGYTVSGNGFNATATDNCGVSSITHNYNWGNPYTLNGATFPVGSTIVTWTVTDIHGNSSTCSNTIVVTDNEDPVFVNCPNGEVFTIGADANCANGVIWSIPVVQDNCGVVSYTETSVGGPFYGEQLSPGTYNIVYTATDAANNSTTCGFTVVIVDDENPYLVCQPNMIIPNDPGVCTWTSAENELNPLLSVDNCPSYHLQYRISGATEVATWTNGVVTPTTFNLGISTVTYRLFDNSSATDTIYCSFTITVIDNEAPQLNCHANLNVSTNSNLCTYSYNPTLTSG